MTLTRFGVAIVLAAAAALAAAQSASSPSSPAKKQLVAKLLQLQQPGIEGVGSQIAGQTSQQIMVAAGQALQRVSPDKREATAKDIEADVRKFHDEIAPLLRTSAVKLAPGVIGVSLEERFSEDELKTVIAWLESPVSRKYQQLSVEQGQALTQKVVAENRGAIEPKMQALQESVGRKLGLAPAGAAASAPTSAAPAAKPAASAPRK